MDIAYSALLAFETLSMSAFAPAGTVLTQAMVSPTDRVVQFQEDYNDWRVACAETIGKTRCTLQQRLIDTRRRQDVLYVEIGVPDGGGLGGMLVLPLGIAIDQETSIAVDGSLQRRVIRIHTCLPEGCVARLAFDETFMTSLRTGRALKVSGFSAVGQGVPVNFSISLSGFPEALDRSIALMALQGSR